MQIKTAILNILIDRISTELTKGQGGAEIDDELPKRAGSQDFKKALHQLLMTLSTNWTEQRTADIIRTIKDYNARPPFPKKVARACAQQQLPPMAGKLLGTRHLLLHVGKLEPPDGDVIGYWMELDALVLMLILRMLRYEGQLYHPKYGADGIVLKDKLVVPDSNVSSAAPAIVPGGRRNNEANTREMAYKFWMERGCPLWDDQRDWYAAEAQDAG